MFCTACTLYNTITDRIHADLYDYRGCDPSVLHAVAVVTARLLNEASSLLEEFAPQALTLRDRIEKGEF